MQVLAQVPVCSATADPYTARCPRRRDTGQRPVRRRWQPPPRSGAIVPGGQDPRVIFAAGCPLDRRVRSGRCVSWVALGFGRRAAGHRRAGGGHLCGWRVDRVQQVLLLRKWSARRSSAAAAERGAADRGPGGGREGAQLMVAVFESQRQDRNTEHMCHTITGQTRRRQPRPGRRWRLCRSIASNSHPRSAP
jgi:hypothetical protein